MARPAAGQVSERPGKSGVTFALRFRAYGKREYVTLGTKAEGWSRAKAEDELANVLADVRRGIWQSQQPVPVRQPAPEPTFLEFASEWFAAKQGNWRPNTRADYKWALELHLLPFFRTTRSRKSTRRPSIAIPPTGGPRESFQTTPSTRPCRASPKSLSSPSITRRLLATRRAVRSAVCRVRDACAPG